MDAQQQPTPQALSAYNTRVMKEPRGMIRLIQLVRFQFKLIINKKKISFF